MALDPFEQWRTHRRRARGMALLICALTALTLVFLFPYLEQAEVRGVLVDPGPETSRDHQVFGTLSPSHKPQVQETADTALDPLSQDLLTPLDRLRDRHTWCGEAAPALQYSHSLTEAAERQAAWLAQSGERRHRTPRSPSGATPQQRATQSGYFGPVGEVIAWGQRDGQTVMDGWEASPTHCSVVMDPAWDDVGWAMEDHVWVMMFGTKPP